MLSSYLCTISSPPPTDRINERNHYYFSYYSSYIFQMRNRSTRCRGHGNFMISHENLDYCSRDDFPYL